MPTLDPLSELCVRWEDARRRGEVLTPEQLCADHPELLAPLREQIRILESMDPFLGEASLFVTPSPGGRATPPGSATPPGPLPDLSGSRYRPLRFLGAGGLGQVYLAFDEELRREVALKFVRPGIAGSDAALRRFRREAEVTGQLEHPTIPPVYGLVRNPADGSFCYAMRFINGETLSRLIEQYHAAPDARGLRSLLGHFVAVCRAVAFAHDKGFLHRDIKPGNIMAGRYGETWLLDWGLAGRIREAVEVAPDGATTEPDDSLTRAGVAAGTPGFMAPEQAAGDWDLVGTAADVFSLGVTLASMLLGRGPRPNQPIESFVNDALPAPLAAVVHKATMHDASMRYESATALADEVERFLADEPVSAYRDPIGVRVRRWAKRNRTAVVGGFLTLVTAVVGLTFGLLAVSDEQEKTEFQRNAAVDSRNEANRQRDLALQSLRGVVYDIYTLTAGKPTLRELQETLLTRARVGLERLATDDRPDPEADKTKLAVLVELGQLFLEAKIEKIGEARGLYEYAAKLAARRAAAEPDSWEAARDVALTKQLLGQVRLTEAQFRDADTAFSEAAVVFRELAERFPDHTPDHRFLLLKSLRGRSAALQVVGDPEAALASTKEELPLLHALMERYPDDWKLKQELATTAERAGSMLLELGRPIDALRQFQSANAANLAIVKHDPADPEPVFNLALSTHQLANACWLAGLEQAGAYAEQTENIIATLLTTDARHVAYLMARINNQAVLMNVYLSANQLNDAKQAAVRWRSLAEEASKASRGNVLFDVEVTNSLFALGLVNQWDGDDTSALTFYRDGLERFGKLEKSGKIRDFPVAQAFGDLFAVKIASLEGRHREALALADRLAARPGLSWFGPFHAACAYGRAAKESPDRGRMAVLLLRKAGNGGLRNAAFLRGSPDLAPLRERPDFGEWLKECN